MDKAALLGELRALADSLPDFDKFLDPKTRRWLARGHALLSLYNRYEAHSFQLNSNLSMDLLRNSSVASLVGALDRAVAALELEVGATPASAVVYGPGAVYDFMKNLRDLIASAQQSLLIVDPYMDEQIFDAYLSTAESAVHVRLLAKKCSASMKSTLAAFTAQRATKVELRASSDMHDRVFFIDGTSCWVLGQSVANAAQRMPTYLAPLSADVAPLKLAMYEAVWAGARLAE